MMDKLDFSQEPDLGYYFYPPEIDEHPGHPRMDVILTATPTNRHFDPLRVSYLVALRGGTERLVVCHPWGRGRRFRVCAGRIIVSDRLGKTVEAFSLGGDLQIACFDDLTVCGLVSPAPIFPLYSTLDLPMWLTCEMEILLAQQKARWDPAHPFAFEEHLAEVDPIALYACLLTEQHKKAGELHSGSDELDFEGQHFVRDEIGRLKEDGRWPQEVCTPEQLLTGRG